MISTLVLAPIFFGLDLDSMSVSEASAALQRKGFTVWERPVFPQRPESGEVSVDELSKLIEEVAEKSDWALIHRNDIRFKPPPNYPEIRSVVISSCPPTARVGSVGVTYKTPVSIDEFGRVTARVTGILRVDPTTAASSESLTLRWTRLGAETALAIRSRSYGQAWVWFYGKPADVKCSRDFWLAG